MTQPGPTLSVIRRSIWAGPLLLGLSFGLAYGMTQRLLAFNVGELIRFGQGFDVQVFPGTSLESLRLRFGAADAEVRGNLDLQQLERQQQDTQTPAPQDERSAPTPPPTAAETDPVGDGLDGASGAGEQPPAAETPATPPQEPAAPPPLRP